ncbi:MAG: tyrosine-type recombinase/integrase [Bacilli bacterium]
MNNEKNKETWLKKIEETLELGGRSKTTIRNYKYAINHFLSDYSDKKKISDFKEEEIIKYLKKNYIDNNCSANTYNFNLSVIKFFYSVCFNKEFSKRTLPKSKIPRRLPKIVSKKNFIFIFNNDSNLEHKCWLLLSFCSGLRVEEIADLKIENIDSKNHKLRIIGKGNKERNTILPDITIKYLRLYYKSKNMKIKTGYFFKGINGNEHISKNTIGNYFTNLSNELNLEDGISFHTLRHSFATYYLMNGGNSFILKSMLGHRSLSTTAIYVHLANNFNKLEGIKYV